MTEEKKTEARRSCYKSQVRFKNFYERKGFIRANQCILVKYSHLQKNPQQSCCILNRCQSGVGLASYHITEVKALEVTTELSLRGGADSF